MSKIKKIFLIATTCLSLSLVMAGVTFAETTQSQSTTEQVKTVQTTEDYNKKYEDALTEVIELEKLFDVKEITPDIVSQANDKINELETILKELNTNDMNGLQNRIDAVKAKADTSENNLVQDNADKRYIRNLTEVNQEIDRFNNYCLGAYNPSDERDLAITSQLFEGYLGGGAEDTTVTKQVKSTNPGSKFEVKNNDVYFKGDANECLKGTVVRNIIPPEFVDEAMNDEMDSPTTETLNIVFNKGDATKEVNADYYVGTAKWEE